MSRDQLPARTKRSLPAIGAPLTAAEYHALTAVPTLVEWLANVRNPSTRRAYQRDVSEFSAFCGLSTPDDFRIVTRAHVIAWRRSIEAAQRKPATIRRKLAALSSLYAYLTERNAVPSNPVMGVQRPPAEHQSEGATPALAVDQARLLLDAPPSGTAKGLRDRAILSVLLYHGLRRAELCGLVVGDIQIRRGVAHLRVCGKGGKTRFVPLHPAAAERIEAHLTRAGLGADAQAPLWQPAKRGAQALTPDGLYKSIVLYYSKRLGFGNIPRLGPHALRATAATTALDNDADIAQVQEWLGHANISTTRVYDRRRSRPENSPTYKVRY